MRRRKWTALVAVCAALSLVASACGGDDDDEGSKAQEGKLTAGPGFDPDKAVIKVGAISALTGPVGILGIPITEGTKVFFESLNARGGVAGKYKVEVVVEDSAYDNNTAITKYEKIKGDVVMLAQLLGTGVTQAVLPKLKADKMMAAPASLDAEWQAEENLLPVGGPYQIEFINAAHYYVTEGGGKGKNICMLAINIPYGQAGVEGLQAAAKAEGFEIKATARFEPTDQEFTAQVTQLKNAKCDAVFLTSLPSNTGPILGTAAKLGFTPQWFGQAPTFITAQAASPQLAPILEKTFLLASEGPQWGDESTPGMKEMLADIAKFRPAQAPDFYFTFGYTLAKVTAALLEKAVAKGDLSRQGILDAVAELGQVDVGGLFGPTTYGRPADRNPSRLTTIFKVNPKVPGAWGPPGGRVSPPRSLIHIPQEQSPAAVGRVTSTRPVSSPCTPGNVAPFQNTGSAFASSLDPEAPVGPGGASADHRAVAPHDSHLGLDRAGRAGLIDPFHGTGRGSAHRALHPGSRRPGQRRRRRR